MLDCGVGLDSLGFLKMADCFRQSAGNSGEGDSEIDVRTNVIRAQAQGCFKMRDSLGLTSGDSGKNDSEIILRLGVSRLEAQGLFEMRDRFLRAAFLRKRETCVVFAFRWYRRIPRVIQVLAGFGVIGL